MAKLTYANKSALNENPSIAVQNKITDDDMNEIKTVVNENDDNVGDLTTLKTSTKTSVVGSINELVDSEVYSSTETKTNKTWVDGKPIYRKYWTGSIGTASQKQVDTISNYGECTGYFLKLVTATGGNWMGYLTSSVASGLQISAAGLMTIFRLGTESVSYKLVVEYTKSTD